MIEIKKLNELVKLMVDNDLTEVDLKDGEDSITIKRGVAGGAPVVQYAPAPQHHAAPAPAPAPAPGGAAPAAPAPSAGDPNLKYIESPMVGTFYSASNPDSPPFVKPGQQIGGDTVVCLIEAMKVFNEIKAEMSGTIEQVFVKNGEAVEFGQKLFAVRA